MLVPRLSRICPGFCPAASYAGAGFRTQPSKVEDRERLKRSPYYGSPVEVPRERATEWSPWSVPEPRPVLLADVTQAAQRDGAPG